MAYNKNMGSDRPGLFVFVLDQSGSMGEAWPQSPKHSKADALADVLNNTLAEVAARSVRGEGQVSDRCEIAVVGYEGSSTRNLWTGPLAQSDIVPISQVSANPLEFKKTTVQVENGAGGTVDVEQDIAVWVKPNTGGGTPMKEGLQKAFDLVQSWLPKHQDSFPPVVIHVTDGEPTSGDPAAVADAIKNLKTSDGNVLLVNIHLPSGAPITALFPSDASSLPNVASAQRLFQMSSVLPAELLEKATAAGLPVVPNSRLMILNADAISVIRLISFATIGTMGTAVDK